MVFKATTATLEQALTRIELSAADVKAASVGLAAKLSAPVSYWVLAEYLATLKGSKELMESLKDTPGLAQYAKDQRNDQTYEIVAEYVAMIAAIDAAGDWLAAGFNSVATLVGYNVSTWAEVPNEFGTAMTASLVPLVNAVIAAID